ncbi:arylamine N-acetyltransferase [Salibacterium aidingense]|uniref:arylamine N-acetyltransferase n=1 Tax=Salibacterium aidingense TaxID=384933 RepID=UPI003BC7B9B9
MNASRLPEWVHAYLEYIQVPLKNPSYEYLIDLCTAHLNNIPFENISTLLQYKHGWDIPNEEQFVHQLHENHMGGTCYAINSNFCSLLNHLGFYCRYTQLGTIHLGMLVQMPHKDEYVYADCGTAAPLFEPLRFETDPHNISSFGGISVLIHPEEEPGGYTFYRYVDGSLIKQTLWSFNIKQTYSFNDFTTPIQEYFQPGSLFMTTLRCQMWQQKKNRSLSLVNNILNIRDINGEVEKHELSSIKDIRNVIEKEFQLPHLPLEEAVTVLQELGIDIFQHPRKDHNVNLG